MSNKTKTWLWFFFAFAILFFCTAQHDVSWQDSGEYQWRCLQGDYTESVPLCRSHPAYLLIGNILSQWPGWFPYSLNLFSGLMAAVLLANLSLLAAELNISRRAAVPVIITLGLSHCLWWLATIAEVYPFSASVFTLELLFFVRLCKSPSAKSLCLLAFANGLGLSIHNFALIALPVYFLALVYLISRKRMSNKAIIPALAVWLLGLSPLLTVICIKISATPGNSFIYWLRDILVGNYGEQVFNVSGNQPLLKVNLALAGLSFLSLLLPLALMGLRFWLKENVRGVLLKYSLIAILIMHFGFFVRYTVPDQFTFIIPTMIMLSLFAMAALEKISESRKVVVVIVLVFALMQPIWYATASFVLGSSKMVKREYASADRDEARYWVVPWKHNERSAENWAGQVVEILQ
ncbi:MAG: DUF2723 domain-containing protein, partial [Sedimentisphaerales bacterium]|nr:DUF2723 domain-containing protein [Sedimentisphaerales bacterium]